MADQKPELGLPEIGEAKAITKEIADALTEAIRDFEGRKNSPFTRFKLAAHMTARLEGHLGKKLASKHFSVMCGSKGINIIPLTPWAKIFLDGARA